MKVLMLGWEFPPYIAGGLGTACYGLTRAINGLGVDVLFVLPRPVTSDNGSGTISLADPHYAFRHAEMAAEAAQHETGGYSEEPAPAQPPAPAVPAARNGQASGKKKAKASPAESASTPGTIPAAASIGPAFQMAGLPQTTFRRVDALLSPYSTPQGYAQARATARGQAQGHAAAPTGVPAATTGQAGQPAMHATGPSAPPAPHVSDEKMPTVLRTPTAYASDLFAETERYARLVASIAASDVFDVVHAHDWMTFQAGIAAAKRRHAPLIVHVHSTEFDRNGRHPDPRIVEIEREGVQAAARVVAVSYMTKRTLVNRYGADPEKIDVIHNAVELPASDGTASPDGTPRLKLEQDEKVVLFLGRITAQKGPEYFLAAARKVLDVYDNVKFIMAGAGDMIRPTIELAAAMGIGHKVLFTGFLTSQDVRRAFQMADLYVMPSVSEPFGIAPLEALTHDVPVIISKQSGVSEVLQHVLKVDFWDIDDLANKILAVLRLPVLAETLRKRGKQEVEALTWQHAAEKVVGVYDTLTGVPA